MQLVRRVGKALGLRSIMEKKEPKLSTFSSGSVVSTPKEEEKMIKTDMLLNVEKPDEYDKVIKLVGSSEKADVIIAVARKYAGQIKIFENNPNDAIHQRADIKLCGRQVPKITLVGYLARLVKMLNNISLEPHDFTSIGFQCLMIGTIYIDRLLSRGDFKLDAFNIHRVFLGSMILAFKFAEDKVHKLKTFAAIGGIDAAQLKMIESEICRLINFQFNIKPETELQQKFNEFCNHFEISSPV